MDDRKYSSSQHERFSRLGSEAAPARRGSLDVLLGIYRRLQFPSPAGPHPTLDQRQQRHGIRLIAVVPLPCVRK
jgi:hypothetical protein